MQAPPSPNSCWACSLNLSSLKMPVCLLLLHSPFAFQKRNHHFSACPWFYHPIFTIIPHFTRSLTSSWVLISCCWTSCHQNSPRIVWVLFLIATNEPTSSLILSYQQDITCLPQNSPDLSNPAFSPWAYVFIVFGKGKFPLQTQRAWAGFIWERLCCICPAGISWHFGIEVDRF